LTKNAVLNLAPCCGAILRHREKMQYRCTTTVHRVHNCQKIFWKVYFLCDFWCAQTCSLQAIFGLQMRDLTILLVLY